MRAIHNTPIPSDEWEFPIPDDCVCEGGELCDPCKQVEAQLEEQERSHPQ